MSGLSSLWCRSASRRQGGRYAGAKVQQYDNGIIANTLHPLNKKNRAPKGAVLSGLNLIRLTEGQPSSLLSSLH